MAGANDMAIATVGGGYASLARGLRVEKAHITSDLRNETPRDGERRGAGRRAQDVANVSRSDTAQSEPLWNGPRLSAAFVAQVIGQLLEERPLPVHAAYRRSWPQPPRPRVFDDAA
jgi:hypothetical protein